MNRSMFCFTTLGGASLMMGCSFNQDSDGKVTGVFEDTGGYESTEDSPGDPCYDVLSGVPTEDESHAENYGFGCVATCEICSMEYTSGFRVNGMLVGQIVSDQIARRFNTERPNMTFDEFVAKAGVGIPVGRMGKAEEFAAMACLLCSDLGGFTTGTAINMDGGASPVV